MADDWVDVPPAPTAAPPVAAAAPADDGWVDVPKEGDAQAGPQVPNSGAPGFSTAAKPFVNSTGVGTVMKAFGEGYGEAWGPDRLGLSKESTEWLAKVGIFASGSKFENPFQAFNEGVIIPAAAALDAATRLPGAVYRGLQSAGVAAGLPGDIVSIPDAFMGSPGSLGEIKMRPGLPKDEPIGAPAAIVATEAEAEAPKPNPVAVAVDQGKDLGIIGPEKPPITEGSPKDAAEAVVSRPAEGPKGDKITQPVGGDLDPWQQRFEGFVSKLDAPGDVQQLIRDSAKENGDFLPARQGDIPLSHVEGIAEAAGVDPSEVNARGLGRKLQNDNEVRTAMRLMLQVTDDVKNAARDVKADNSPENLIKLQEAIMRRDMSVEQVVGLRAEWGRTGGVFQEFMRDVKDQQGLSDFLKDKGRSPSDLNDIAHTIDSLDRGQAARLLNDLRTPTAWDKFKYYWVNSLISGPVTHAKYIVANAAYAGYESAVVTPVAGVIGAARRALTGGEEGVYMGEAAARTWGIVAGVPDAMKAAVRAAKTGMQTPLPGELAQSIIPKNNKNVTFQQKPIGGLAGAIIGAPSRGASAIHSFFNFIGYRASVEAQAYRQAAKEGLKLSDDAFWQRRADIADKPTPEVMNNAIEEGYRLTYITELGETGRKLSAFVNATKVGQLVMPFTHIPLNILKRATEGTPAAFLDADTRAALTGTQGAVKQDMAIARMVAGSAVGAWAVNLFLNDRLTGYGPTDQKERAQWMATGHQPYSIRIGDEWLSFNRFGSLGTMMGLYSNLAEVIPHLKPDTEELTKAIAMTVHSTGRLMEDEVGMQGLAGLMEAIDEPDRKGVRFVSNFAGSLLPYSSAQRQVASSMDPYMRDTKSIVDGLRYYVPGFRQGLNPKRDWLGSPISNASYGGDTAVPGASSIIQHRDATPDPISQEMTTLDLRPAIPQDRIKGVKLPPKLYDTYQATAGPFLRQTLGSYINQPGWHDIPVGIRQELVRNAIRTTRNSAAAAMQMQHPEIIQQGVADRVARINGVKPTKLKE